jgi:hypothetical protein
MTRKGLWRWASWFRKVYLIKLTGVWVNHTTGLNEEIKYNIMGHWEDFWWETHKQLDELGLRAKFDAQLKKMRFQDKHQYMESRERWRYALDKVVTAHKKIKTTA